MIVESRVCWSRKDTPILLDRVVRIDRGKGKAPKIYGVINAVEGAFAPGEFPRLFPGSGSYSDESGGQAVLRIIKRCIQQTRGRALINGIMGTNTVIQGWAKAQGLDISDPNALPGASVGFARIDEKSVEVVQGGSTEVAILMKDGHVVRFGDQAWRNDAMLDSILAEFKEEESDFQTAYRRLLPIRAEARRRHINNPESDQGFAHLNGQEEVRECLQTGVFHLDDVQMIILHTDGLIPPAERREGVNLDLLDRKGVRGLHNHARQAEAAGKGRLHIRRAPYAVCILHFDDVVM